MKVLLLKDVKGSGTAGAIVEVSDGYARNYLVPKGLAVPADAQNLNAARIKSAALVHKAEEQKKAARDLANHVNGLSVKVRAKAGENGRLFGSVTAKEIAAGLKEQFNIDVDKKKISLPEPIRELGVVEVAARLGQADARFLVEVLPIEE